MVVVVVVGGCGGDDGEIFAEGVVASFEEEEDVDDGVIATCLNLSTKLLTGVLTSSTGRSDG